MAHDAHIRAKARKLRLESGMTLDEIAERLAMPRSTVFYWLRDLPALNRKGRGGPGSALGTARMQEKYARIRADAYDRGLAEFDALSTEPTFRDFVCMYVGEGYKRDRNAVSICNSDPSVVLLAHHWIPRLAINRVGYSFQYHVDQEPRHLAAFWAATLGIEVQAIKSYVKSNSGRLSNRTWRSEYGVMQIRAADTVLRARLSAWMDRVRGDWPTGQ